MPTTIEATPDSSAEAEGSLPNVAADELQIAMKDLSVGIEDNTTPNIKSKPEIIHITDTPTFANPTPQMQHVDMKVVPNVFIKESVMELIKEFYSDNFNINNNEIVGRPSNKEQRVFLFR